MAQSENKIVTDLNELNTIFEHDEKRQSIQDKLVMPIPGDKGKIVRFLVFKGDNGSYGPIKVVKNDKFNAGSGVFMNVEELSNPGVELQMSLGISLKGAIDRMCNTQKWTLTDLPGKIVHITANYYTAKDAPKCSKCGGRGCPACGNTGNSTVFNVRPRIDLMSATAGATKAANKDDF